MGRLAIINGTNVVNVIEVDENFVIPDDGLTYIGVSGTEVSKGWLFSDGEFLKPVPEDPLLSPLLVSRSDFLNLLTDVQRMRINIWRKAGQSLTVDDYSDPSMGLTVQMEVTLQKLDSDLIYLHSEDTQLSLELLGYAGVFGEEQDVVTSEILRIRQGLLPTRG